MAIDIAANRPAARPSIAHLSKFAIGSPRFSAMNIVPDRFPDQWWNMRDMALHDHTLEYSRGVYSRRNSLPVFQKNRNNCLNLNCSKPLVGNVMRSRWQTIIVATGLAALGLFVVTSDHIPPEPNQQAAAGANVARDGEIAVKEEFDAAMEAGTTDRLELFLARHPDSRFAARATQALDALRRQGSKPTGKSGLSKPGGD